MQSPLPCPVCEGASTPLDVVDFNKSCEETRGRHLPLSGIPVYYFLCGECGFCFAPEFAHWTLHDFEQRIYNSEYAEVDPDYLEARPRANAEHLLSLFGDHGPKITHLDYGGGGGLMSRLLREAKWQTGSYDPFVDRGVDPAGLGRFDLVTAYEVFEHVPDAPQLVANLSSLLVEDGVVLFSTLVSDGNLHPCQRITWWYAAPRNGHISLYSKQSLAILGAREGFNFGSFSDVFHAYWRAEVPPWARHVVRVNQAGVR